MAWEDANGGMALDASVVEQEKRVGTVAHYVAKLASVLGLAVDPTNGRLRVNVETGAVTATVSGNITTVTTVTTVAAITATNGMGTVAATNVNPGAQVFAGMTMPALELRNRIVVS